MSIVQGNAGAFYGTTLFGGPNNQGTIFKINPDGSGYFVLHSFGSFPGDGVSQIFALTLGVDGFLYGTTGNGGTNGGGIVFKIGPDGNDYEVLHNFNSFSGDGNCPVGRLLLDKDGTIYGTTILGGTNQQGILFALNTNGGNFEVLRTFGDSVNDAQNANGLVKNIDGYLYGTSSTGGSSNSGTIFMIGTNGLGYKILHSFTGVNGDGLSPNDLVVGADGTMYGSTSSGGGKGFGTIFKIGLSGNGYDVLTNFALVTNGASPVGRLALGADGELYGTTAIGPTNTGGTVFKMNPNGTGYTILRSFAPAPWDGSGVQGVVLGSDGQLYGTAGAGGLSGGGTAFRLNTNGDDFIILRNFSAGGGDGTGPSGPLASSADGFIYGVTGGGSNGLGTVYKIYNDGSLYTVLHTFSYLGGDGKGPNVIFPGSDGRLYGATGGGGADGWGTLFQMDRQGGNYAVIFSFPTSNSGVQGLLQGNDGELYGITFSGGTNYAGTLFRIETNGSAYTVIHDFVPATDGKNPASLFQSADGFLYGLTEEGGAGSGGTIFKVGTSGNNFSVIKNFGFYGTDGPEGYAPVSLIGGGPGVLYGATYRGGGADLGTVFSINTDGSGLTVLHDLGFGGMNARYLFTPLLWETNGTLYGASFEGGSNDVGTVFGMSTNGTGFTVYHSFGSGANDGENPSSSLCLGADGALYGVAQYGGSSGLGTLFKISNEGAPAILAQPSDTTATYQQGNTDLAVIASGGGLSFQWLFNNTPIANATNSALLLSGITRADGGSYTVMVTNAFGSILSSNALLKVQVPQQLANAALSSRGFTLLSGFADGSPVMPSDLANLEAQTSTNLLNWITLSNSLALSNGVLVVDDTNISSRPAQFYRLIEH